MPSSDNKSRIPLPANTSPEGTCCITVPLPDDLEWKATFLGNLHRLTQQVWFERDADYSAKDVAAVWQAVYDCVSEQINMADCCGGNTVQDIKNFVYQQQTINQINRGITLNWQQQWIDATNDVTAVFIYAPDTYYATDSSDTGNDGQIREEALCFAVRELINGICNAGMNLIEGYAIDIVQLAVPLAATGIPGLVIALTGVALIIDGHQILANEDYREYLICCMYSALVDNVDINSTAAFETALDGVCEHDPFGTAEAAVTQWVKLNLSLDNYFVFVDFLGSAFGAVQLGATLPCPCGTWEYDLLAGNGNGALVNEQFDETCMATYQGAPFDRYIGCCTGAPTGNIFVGLSLDGLYGNFNLTEILVEYDANGTTRSVPRHIVFFADDLWFNDQFAEFELFPLGNDQTVENVSLDATMQSLKIYINFPVENTTCPQTGFYFRLNRLRLRGTGRNPFT